MEKYPGSEVATNAGARMIWSAEGGMGVRFEGLFVGVAVSLSRGVEPRELFREFSSSMALRF